MKTYILTLHHGYPYDGESVYFQKVSKDRDKLQAIVDDFNTRIEFVKSLPEAKDYAKMMADDLPHRPVGDFSWILVQDELKFIIDTQFADLEEAYSRWELSPLIDMFMEDYDGWYELRINEVEEI